MSWIVEGLGILGDEDKDRSIVVSSSVVVILDCRRTAMGILMYARICLWRDIMLQTIYFFWFTSLRVEYKEEPQSKQKLKQYTTKDFILPWNTELRGPENVR